MLSEGAVAQALPSTHGTSLPFAVPHNFVDFLGWNGLTRRPWSRRAPSRQAAARPRWMPIPPRAPKHKSFRPITNHPLPMQRTQISPC